MVVPRLRRERRCIDCGPGVRRSYEGAPLLTTITTDLANDHDAIEKSCCSRTDQIREVALESSGVSVAEIANKGTHFALNPKGRRTGQSCSNAFIASRNLGDCSTSLVLTWSASSRSCAIRSYVSVDARRRAQVGARWRTLARPSFTRGSAVGHRRIVYGQWSKLEVFATLTTSSLSLV